MLVGKNCRRDVVTIRSAQSVVEAARQMRQHHVGDLVVVDDGGAPVGVLTDRDLVVCVLAREADRIAQLQVGDVLTDEVLLARESEDVSEVLRHMQRERVRRVPVVDEGGVLVGILTLDDILGVVSGDLANVAHLVKSQGEHEHERRP
jgi:CBS domain-containing protein